MDSKLKRITVICSVLMVLLIGATVAGIGILQKQGGSAESMAEKKTQTGTAPSEEGDVDYSAFLGDETFFDRDKSDYEKLLESTGRKLSLFATSVERDLRVQVLNEVGEQIGRAHV